MKPTAIVLIFTMLLAGHAATALAGDPSSRGNLQEQLRDAMPGGPGNTAGHVTNYVLFVIEALEIGFGVAEKTALLGSLALPLEVTGPIAGMAAVWVELGNAHADAINSLIREQIVSGFSRGVVLGADRRPADYVKYNFVKYSPVPNSVYPEFGRKFQNAYNSALVAGYAQGKALTKEQSGAFFSDLFARMSENPAVTYGEDSKLWTDKNWTDYYTDCAIVFTRDHLK
jgi:hypothetical protein